jgi:hypothetical protein
MIVRFLLGLALFSCTAHAWSQGCTAIQVGDPCLPPEMVYPHMNDPAPARPPAPVRPTKPLFGAIAKDNLNRLSWVLNDKSEKNAVATSVDACEKKGGTGCQAISFKNTCRALAIDDQGKISIFDDELYPETAARFALEACDKSNPIGACRLMALPICSSPILSTHQLDMVNGAAAHATAANIADLAAKVNPREHWVTIAAGKSEFVYYSVGQTHGSASEELALAQCNAKDSDCRVVQSTNDGCVGIGFVKKAVSQDDRIQDYFGADPNGVLEEVKSRCRGACGKIRVLCSGTKYPKAAPFDLNFMMTGLGSTPNEKK